MAITPVLDTQGKPKQYIAISNDITPLKNAQLQVEQLLSQSQETNEELEASAEELRQTLEYSLDVRDRIVESESRYRLISESMQDLICLHDRKGCFTYVSPSSSALLGYAPEELLGRLPGTLVHPDHWESFVSNVRTLADNGEGTCQLAYRIRTKKGEYRWLETLMQPLLNEQGLLVGWHSASRDVTQRKSAEESLQLTLKELQQRNLELDHYAYRVSHDLRAPLCSIKGLSSLIAEETNLDAIKEFNKLIEDRVTKSDEFISSVLAHTQMLSAPQQHVPIDLQLLIEDCWQELGYLPGWERIKLSIRVKPGVPFFGDPFRLAIVFRNFVSNAVKYLNPEIKDNYLRFRIQVTSEQATIRIHDNGIGIQAQYLPHLFEMFFRATEKSTGSGLGLYIVKKALEQMQGQLEVESEPNQGTTFSIFLPNFSPPIQ